MSDPTAGQCSSISQHLRETKKVLQGVVFNANVTATLDAAEVDILAQGSFEVLRLVRVRKNMLAPINKIPPEILTLIPDFWNHKRDRDIIALTHICQTWREVFVSRPSLWTNFDCLGEEKTRIYLERSKSFPIDLSLIRNWRKISLCEPFLQIIPHATGRLRSLFVGGPSANIRVITSHLSHPAPLLERLSICCSGKPPYCDFVLTPTLFNGDLSSLHMLRLERIHTELPWRKMDNLTSFTLSRIPPGAVSVGQLLDFFENAPYLEEVKLCFVIPTTGAQNRRLVSLACLKSMDIDDDNPFSILLDHLLIPVGAKLEIGVDLLSSSIRESFSRSLDNLQNFSDFTTIKLRPDKFYPRMKFSGPNGQVNITLRTNYRTSSVLGSLGEFNTSNTKRLEIDGGEIFNGDPLYRALLPMKDLRTLTLSGCKDPDIFIGALQPATCSSEVAVCPKLEEFVLVLHHRERESHITSVIEMAAARASRGEKLKTVKIFDGRDAADLDVSELKKHVWNVEYCPEVWL